MAHRARTELQPVVRLGRPALPGLWAELERRALLPSCCMLGVSEWDESAFCPLAGRGHPSAPLQLHAGWDCWDRTHSKLVLVEAEQERDLLGLGRSDSSRNGREGNLLMIETAAESCLTSPPPDRVADRIHCEKCSNSP